MIERRLIIKNVTLSISQVLYSGGVLFLLYRFLLNTIGVEKLGVWSLILSTTSLTNIANLGLTGSVVKFVAKYKAREEPETLARLIHTAVAATAVCIAVFVIGIYFFAGWVVGQVVPEAYAGEALALIPYALTSLWLNAVGGVFLSGIDGFQHTYIRSVLLMSGFTVYPLLCVLLVPEYQLVGLGLAQVLQGLFVSVAGLVVLRRFIPALSMVPVGWDKGLFREMFSYGMNFQIRSISSMLFDPTTKAILTKFGGLQMVGFYEMANRMIMQFRSLILNANRVLVPTIAHVHEKEPEYVHKIYRESYQMLLLISVPLFACIAAFAPYISLAWVGGYERDFVVFTMLLSAGWFANMLVGPAYFANLGIGELRWNTIAHLIIGVLNGVLGFAAGAMYGGMGVVVASVFSLVVGSAVIPLAYHRRHSIPLRVMFPRDTAGVVVSSLAAMAVTLAVFYRFGGEYASSSLAAVSALAFVAISALPVWRHPTRARIMELLSTKKPRRA